MYISMVVNTQNHRWLMFMHNMLIARLCWLSLCVCVTCVFECGFFYDRESRSSPRHTWKVANDISLAIRHYIYVYDGKTHVNKIERKSPSSVVELFWIARARNCWGGGEMSVNRRCVLLLAVWFRTLPGRLPGWLTLFYPFVSWFCD